MRIKYKRIAALALAAGLLASCATGGGGSSSFVSGGKKAPSWIADKHSAYPAEQYLVEIGEGPSLKASKDDAKAALAQIFGTTVKVDSRVSTRYKDLSDGDTILESQLETTADESITQLSNETLINVHFGESWTDPLGKVFTVAYIDRMETAQIYRRRIDQDGARADYFMRKSAEQSDLIRRFGFLDAAVVMDTEINAKQEQLEIISPTFAGAVLLPYNREQLRSLHADTGERMLFSLAFEGDRVDKLKSIVSQVLTDRGFSVSDGAAPLAVNGRIYFEEVELDNNYENVRWNLFMEMKNEKGETVVSIEEKKRVSGISQAEAEAKSYHSIEEVLQKSFIGQLESFFDSFAGN